MAKLEVREIKPMPPPKEYVLTLSEEEAQALRDLLGVCGSGQPVFKGIRDTMEAAGLKYKQSLVVISDSYHVERGYVVKK